MKQSLEPYPLPKSPSPSNPPVIPEQRDFDREIMTEKENVRIKRKPINPLRSKEDYPMDKRADTFDTFLVAYIEAALWSSNDGSDELGGESLDANYSQEDIADETLDAMEADARKFYDANYEDIEDNVSQAGHDFWLTRNRHGTGYWDRPEVYGKDQAKRLTDAAHVFSEVNLYVGDDGKIYQA